MCATFRMINDGYRKTIHKAQVFANSGTMTTYFEDISTIPTKADVEKTCENSDLVATQRYNERQISNSHLSLLCILNYKEKIKIRWKHFHLERER